jgi:hypothetical protein
VIHAGHRALEIGALQQKPSLFDLSVARFAPITLHQPAQEMAKERT